MPLKRSSVKLVFVLACWTLLFSFVQVHAKEPPVPAKYAHWLNEEVNYLITSDERTAFLELKTDQDRDRFMETFWRERNPDPNAPSNAARDEHYQRLEYANEHFSTSTYPDGWETDRGMVYITLGAPQQRQRYPETPELRPLEVWFYETTNGALPVHFYVVFFKPSPAEDYRLYSPYQDRPQKLVNSTNAINNDPVAIQLIQRDINDEIARITLSLIPGEPVDLKEATPTLDSESLLNDIRNYRNLPQIRDQLAIHSASIEGVSHRIVLGEQFSSLAVIATRDGSDRASIHYLLRLLHPGDFAFKEQADSRYYYSVQVEATLSDASGKPVFHDIEALSDYVNGKRLSDLQGKCFGVEGRIPAKPGKYELALSLTNLSTKQAFRQTHSVLVPDFGDRIGISEVFFADALPPERSVSARDPFSFSGVRLRPIGSENAAITQGAPLRAIFQVWAPPGSPSELHGKTLNVHYLIGKINSQSRVEEDQDVDRGAFNEEGDLLLGKDLRTDTLAPGVYRLVIKVTDPDSKATAYQSLYFEVVDPAHPAVALWTLDVPDAPRG